MNIQNVKNLNLKPIKSRWKKKLCSSFHLICCSLPLPPLDLPKSWKKSIFLLNSKILNLEYNFVKKKNLKENLLMENLISTCFWVQFGKDLDLKCQMMLINDYIVNILYIWLKLCVRWWKIMCKLTKISRSMLLSGNPHCLNQFFFNSWNIVPLKTVFVL